MIEVSKRPKEGQFIEMWTYENEIFASTVVINEGCEAIYNHSVDAFVEEETDYHLSDGCEVKWFVSSTN